ncbi:hypothetical protein BAUCODRAFT_36181 [Baudoinia panamericana UAMH 10762]|uniref:Uncharacterized protein n=1 Tax=Baudoinia panamericana (strain UAMH 10762) TaxID=717646 RepID=M2MQG3_BAUPA|nr:uncharacterized protein BAUCODRAFT_36181 [Baudoinia panamericana UAMH 10762]EMC93728.1 hypothetical protein BAUCODRAFT_36181 [Baudoinia panamericana UAMH 10762]
MEQNARLGHCLLTSCPPLPYFHISRPALTNRTAAVECPLPQSGPACSSAVHMAQMSTPTYLDCRGSGHVPFP